ncbi:hypothetical protein JL721_12904 [Aureococcus anophagefferens]|nr:hypothetical protein JL721_12904 [Aureococcus anophagefferens]
MAAAAMEKHVRKAVRILREGDDNAKITATQNLTNLAYNRNNAFLIAEAGGIPLLVELLRDGSATAKRYAAEVLDNVAWTNRANQVQIVAAGAIPPLVELLRDGSAAAKTSAAVTLRSLADNSDANAVAVAAAVGFDALLQLARRGRVNVGNMMVVQFAGIPAKRKAALVAGQLLEAAAPRTRFTKYTKAAIGSYL